MSFSSFNNSSFAPRSNYDFHFNNQPNYSTVPIKKNNYQENMTVKRRSPAEVDAWLTKNEVTVNGHMPNPILEFDESTFPGPIIEQLKKNYQFPTTIQSITWPAALSGHDLISIAKTGSGKTLGFILPAIVHLLNQAPRERNDGPIVLVLLPTRELALQVEEVTKEYGQLMNIACCCCYGGAARANQMWTLKRGVDICIATPGRLLDFLNTSVTQLSRCSFLVLDEADRMLDMGFEPQIRQIVEQIRPDRQTLMFSATWPRDVRQLAADFHKDPIHLTVGSLDLAANHNIEQFVEVIEEYEKDRKLYQVLEKILEEDNKAKVLIFVMTKRTADTLVSSMRKQGFPTLGIHGDKEQREREWVLTEFKCSRHHILVATDVAARGLDVDDIKFVINYDYPNNSEDYVHRIGRTGRRDRTGTSITFFTPQNAPKARDLIKVLEEAKQNVCAELTNLANGSYASDGYGSFRSRGRRGGGGGGYGGGGGFEPTGANRAPFGSNAGFGGNSGGYGGGGGSGGGFGGGYGGGYGGAGGGGFGGGFGNASAANGITGGGGGASFGSFGAGRGGRGGGGRGRGFSGGGSAPAW